VGRVLSNFSHTNFSFGVFTLDRMKLTLTRDGMSIPLTPKEFDTLVALVEANGRVVSKQELLKRVWPDSYVGDGSLARNISVLRKALGSEVIGTVPRRGYRLAVPVQEVETASEESSTVISQPPDEGGAHGSAPLAGLGTKSRISVNARRIAYVVAGVSALVMVLLGRVSISHSKVSPERGAVRIAVLPFANYTGSPQNDYLCDGITEATIAELSRLHPQTLSVIARTSAMRFKESRDSIPHIAEELKADYILESSVRGTPDRLRITTQLVRGSDASHVWTGEYEKSQQNVFDVQQEVSVAVAEEIRLSVNASQHDRLPHAPALDSEAYQDYLLGRYEWNKRTREGLLKSVKYFEQAIARDPGFARAYAGLADSYLVLGGGYLPDIETYQKARAAAVKALQLDNTLSDAYASLAYEEFVNERDMEKADEDYQRALMLDANNASAHHWYAIFLSAMKRPDEAILHIHRAMELDPLAIAIRYNAAWIYLAAQRYPEATKLAEQALELDANCAPARGTLASIYQAQGKYEEAVAEFEKAQSLRHEYSPYEVEVAHTLALEGKKEESLQILAKLLTDRHWGDVAPYSFAVTYAALGQKDRAFEWLKRCADDHSCTATEFNSDRSLDPLRNDPRFAAIAR